MRLDECNTVKDCFLWAGNQWPNFWEFANQQFLTDREIELLAKVIEKDDKTFSRFMDRLKEVSYEKDISPEAKDLLIKGAGAFIKLQRRYNDYKKLNSLSERIITHS
tara:strand:- start:104 stop:424 length:321 start_codon:yes stop_codon:yes gene_type:complete